MLNRPAISRSGSKIRGTTASTAWSRRLAQGSARLAPDEAEQISDFDIPEGIRRSQDAFFRDLPELLKDESLRGQWVIYHGDERIGFAPKKQPLIEECLRRCLKDDEYDVFVVEPQSREPEQIEIVTHCV